MDLVSYLEWLYRQDLVKSHHGQLPFLGLRLESVDMLEKGCLLLDGMR